MTMLPLKTAISDTYPNPSNATARAGFATLWDAVNEFQQKSELDLASAATCDIGGQASTKLRITGTTGITSFGTNYRGPILLRFSSAVAITHNATTLRCPGGASYTVTANEVMMAWPVASVSGTLDGWQLGALSGGSLIGTAAITGGSITGITDLAIADGGTGASTASAAFAALKQAATTSATGVVELATDAEAQTHADTTRAVTPANLATVILGFDQGYQDLSASRSSGVTYTNSTGRTIVVSAWSTTGGTTNAKAECYVNSVQIAFNSLYSNASGYSAFAYFLVPPGATYSITFTNAGVSTKWFELR